MIKSVSKLITGIIIFVVVILLAGGYLGIVPGLSSVFGSDKPRDLGIVFAPGDTLAAQSKTGVKLMALPKETAISESIKFEGKKDVTFEMTSQELSALANNRPWKYYPFSQVQIRVNADSSVEAAGLVDITTLYSYVQALGYEEKLVQEAIQKLPYSPESMPFYIAGKGFVVNNDISLEVNKLEVGRIEVPKEFVSEAKVLVIDALETFMDKVSGFNAESIQVSDGKVHFKGTVPETEATVN
ncbi:hypothetical protein A3K34_01555 [candidate division WWE3 bacterium RIFOXYC1_FULL_40_10]|uniref:Uncharacterized protein n=1 Tax=candidate division WWE3 bacterium RIFOXYA2_FULL_46_9 TaxID=1802636 RepID=A0A1F4W2V2_UNCKA|nr:MAG: hypothetical protein A3K58_01555 [candidate division WWE3 bacterium RIFOXYB1_FULL_40_22]OGC61551.1 MAG: hypothetical protein A3K37_01555 [candidate division WWE3 bacterium RIFOXYA1_FULL_40_11]OGC63598.1 MAG: hypothetical protein A2264_04495 [candidate division WWE3 bacterium RIFOXYA2_FULL_46_9]OGC64770.1 MAG: hypothetical protein A2326_01900 [candidate division WWE3 bacterium RIFOXYB2_FULL_41_6]OGC65934.1 MAG: hypothetical protein A3K34_01555 [candidate division WWE3 bacterium RIFOXYC1_